MAENKLIVKLGADLKEFVSGLKEAGKKAEQTFHAVQGVGSKAFGAVSAGITAASGAISALATGAIQGFADYEQLVGGVETLFGAGGQSLQEYAASVGKSVEAASGEYDKLMRSQETVLKNADNAYKTAGMSANQYMETVTSFSASLLQSVGGDTMKAAQAADQAITDMADNANKMGTSMESIQNAYQGFAKQNYTMLDNLKLGYGGTKSEMERLLRNAEKFSGIKYDISNLNDVYEAIHVVQTEMGITGTTAKEASETIAGSMNAAKAAWSNLTVGIADDDQDFEKLVDNFVDSAETALDNLVPRIKISLSGAVRLIQGLLPVLLALIPELIQDLLPQVAEAGTGIILALAQGLSGSSAALIGTARTVFQTLISGIRRVLPELLPLVGEVAGAFAEGWFQYQGLLFEVGLQLITAIVQGVADNAHRIFHMAYSLVMDVCSSITENLPLIAEAAVQILEALATGLTTYLPFLIPAVIETLETVVNVLIENLPTLVTAALQIIEALGMGLIEALPQLAAKIPAIIKTIVEVLTKAIPQIIRTGVTLLIALVKNLPEVIKTIVEALPDIIKAIINALVDMLPEIIDAGIDLFTALVENLPLIIETIVGAIPEIIGALVSAIWDNRRQLVEAGKNLLEGLWEGIKSLGGWLEDKVGGLLGDVVGGAKKLLGISSPSKVFRQIGGYVTEGFGIGIESGTGNLTRRIRRQLAGVAALYEEIDISELTDGIRDFFGRSGRVPAFAGASPGGEAGDVWHINVYTPGENGREIGEDVAWAIRREKRQRGDL